MAGVVRPGAGN